MGINPSWERPKSAVDRYRLMMYVTDHRVRIFFFKFEPEYWYFRKPLFVWLPTISRCDELSLMGTGANRACLNWNYLLYWDLMYLSLYRYNAHLRKRKFKLSYLYRFFLVSLQNWLNAQPSLELSTLNSCLFLKPQFVVGRRNSLFSYCIYSAVTSKTGSASTLFPRWIM